MSPAKRHPLRAAALFGVVALGALTPHPGFVASAQSTPSPMPANGDIGFASGNNSSFQIFLMSANGKNQRPITNFCATEDDPCLHAIGQGEPHEELDS